MLKCTKKLKKMKSLPEEQAWACIHNGATCILCTCTYVINTFVAIEVI